MCTPQVTRSLTLPRHHHLIANMEMFPAVLLLALIAGSCTAMAPGKLATSQFHENIMKAGRLSADPIPAVASKLGLSELVQAVVKAGLAKTLEGPGKVLNGSLGSRVLNLLRHLNNFSKWNFS